MKHPQTLTAEQQAIIDSSVEHCVITAVAGSGKTTTLAFRIHRLLREGHPPERMLILMFNRSAKEDFEKKLATLCRGQHLKLPEIRTYHAMGYRLYQRFIKDGYLAPINPKVLTEQEVQFQLWQLIRQLAPTELQDEIKRNKKEHVETASHFIELVKSTLTAPDIIFTQLKYSDKFRFLLRLFERFEQWRKDHARITFADMLYEPVKLIHEKPELKTLVTNKMDIILVDEYQDTNEIQHQLLKFIAGQRAKVTVVGDPDQTIYEFRGAKPEYLLNRFAEEFDQPRALTLSYTFRYGHRVALLANHLIHHNQGRNDILSHSHASVGDTQIHLHEEDNGACIVALVDKQIRRNQALEDIAVLCRVWSQSVPIELVLLSRKIPYQTEQGKGAFSTREIVALVYLLEFASGRFSDLSVESRRLRFNALLRFPHTGLKEDKIQRLADILARQTFDWANVLRACLEEDVNPMQKRKLGAFAEAMDLITGSTKTAAATLNRYVSHTGLYEGIRSLALTHDSAEEKISLVKGFLNYIHSLKMNAKETLLHIDQLKDQAREMNKSKGLVLSTIHRAKGLEWPVVVIPGLTEKYFPYSLREKMLTRETIESERRLLYVAMTRTIKDLHLISSPKKDNEGSIKATTNSVTKEQPSRFIKEIQFELSNHFGQYVHQQEFSVPFEAPLPATKIMKRYCELEGISANFPEQPMTEKDEDSEKTSQEIWSLARIQHAIFGPGTISGESDTAFKVDFDDGQCLDFSKKSAHLYFTAL